VLAVQQMLARERLSIDEAEAGRTCFLSHLGAQPKLVPTAWIGHRDLIYALALANLTPVQRTCLARAVLVEHGREFGVGRLRLQAIPSGLPLGGSSLLMTPRLAGPTCLYTWALGEPSSTGGPQPAKCDWLLLRAQPEWALDKAAPPLSAKGLDTLAQIGGEVLVLVGSAVGAVQVAKLCAGRVQLAAHPRFSPYIEGLVPDAPVLLWPHDALDGAGLRRHEVVAAVLVGAPESVRQNVQLWQARVGGRRPIEVAGDHGSPSLVEVAAPGRISREALAEFWRACGRPAVLMTGDPAWAASGAAWLRSLGATVEVHGAATQLELL
jgi:hypothetical protein